MPYTHMVSPPQMPVPLKRMYNANIPRAKITTFFPSCPPMLHTIIKPKLSFFKNCFENGMLTSCVLSYAPMLVKRSVLPSPPEIFLRPFPEKTQFLLTIYPHNYNIPELFLIHQRRKQPFKAVIWVGIL